MTMSPLVLPVALLLWAVGVAWLMLGCQPQASNWKRCPGIFLTIAGIIGFCLSWGPVPHSELADQFMFWLFAISALLCGVLMITARNPVYAALWFALATLGTCGLFLLQSAPFLAAATIIVYAGAVIVTFLFVIMLAQQSGAAGYDQRSQQPIIAIVSAFVLLGAVSWTLQRERPFDRLRHQVAAAVVPTPPPAAMAPMGFELPTGPAPQPEAGNHLSRATAEHPVGELQGLGRSLFGDYLFAVELAGTLLLIASIGAIAIAPRREEQVT